jgi:internalin A
MLFIYLGGLLPVPFTSAQIIPDPNLQALIRSALAIPISSTNSLTTSNLLALTTLSGYSRGITDLTGLEQATNLRRLYLTGNAISDLTPLQSLSGLVNLEVDRNQIVNASPLAGLTNLVSLALGGNPIDDYSALGSLTSLTSLSLFNGNLPTLGLLTNLTRLSALNVYGNGLPDLSPLLTLTNLATLDLRRNGFTNFDGLAGLTNLTQLYLGGNAVSKVAFLPALTHLTFLDLDYDQITDVSPLAGLTNLTYLVLSGNPGITNFPTLTNLTGLVNLELRSGAVSNLAFVSGWSRLRFVDLAYNSITDPSPLNQLTNLVALNLSGNPSGTNLPSITNLSSLWLFNQSLTNVSFLTNRTSLTALGLDDNQIADPSPLKALTNLHYLGLSRNPLANYGFTNLTSLTGLWIEGVGNTNLNFLSGLTALQNLSLRSNRCTDLSPLTNLLHLSTLYAANNRLTDAANLSNLNILTNFSSLTRVELSANLQNLTPGSSLVQGLQQAGVEVNYLPTNQPPAFSLSFSNWYIPANQTSSQQIFLSDALVGIEEVTNTAASSSLGLLPNSNLAISGTNSIRMLVVTPAHNQTGTATLTLTASQPPGGLSTSNHIVVTVMNSVNVPVQTNLAYSIAAMLGRPDTNFTSVDMMNLNILRANGHGVSDLAGLQWASNLTTLFLNGNAITNLSPLQNLTDLVSLNLDNNLIQDVSPLSGLTNLTYLSLNGNTITNLAALSNLTRLTTLNLSGNSITNVDFLTNFTHLAKLDLSTNQIRVINPLGRLSNLTSVHLQLNWLNNITALSGLTNLRFVDLQLNLLQNTNSGAFPSYVSVFFAPQRNPSIAGNDRVLAITSPRNTTTVSNYNPIITGTATTGVGAVVYSVNGGYQQFASTTNQFAKWTAAVSFNPGTNTVTAQSFDYHGNASAIVTNKYFYQVASAFTVITNGSGTVSITPALPAYVGRTYKVTATPAVGSLLSNVITVATSGTNIYPNATPLKAMKGLSIMAEATNTVTINFITNRFINAAGTYYGLFAAPEVAKESAGFLRIKTIPKLGFTGQLRVDGGLWPVAGTFNLDGVGKASVNRTNKPNLTVSLQLGFDDTIGGSVSNTDWVATIDGDRAVFSPLTPPTNFQGSYTLVLPGTPGQTNSPAGSGYATLTVPANGIVKATGVLGDGNVSAPVAASVAADGRWPLFAQQYGKTNGIVIGWLLFTNNAPNSTLIATNLYWIKEAWNGSPLYPAGFTNAGFAAKGSVLTGTPTEPLVFAGAFGTNASITLADGNLSQSITNRLGVGILNKMVIIGTNNSKMTFSFTGKSGLVSGTFTNPVTGAVRAPVKGVYLQSTNYQSIGGYFLGTNQSGSLLIQGY